MSDIKEKLIALVDNYTDPLSVKDMHKADFAEKFANYLLDSSPIQELMKAQDVIADAPTVEAVEVVRCAYCDPGSQDYNPCWLCKKGGTAHDVEHCHGTNYGDYEPMQPHCHLCGRKL